MPLIPLWSSYGDAINFLEDFNSICLWDATHFLMELLMGCHSILYGTPMGVPFTPLRSFHLQCHSISIRRYDGDATHVPEEFLWAWHLVSLATPFGYHSLPQGSPMGYDGYAATFQQDFMK